LILPTAEGSTEIRVIEREPVYAIFDDLSIEVPILPDKISMKLVCDVKKWTHLVL